MRKGSSEGCATPQILFLMNVFDDSSVLWVAFSQAGGEVENLDEKDCPISLTFISIEPFSCVFQVSSPFRYLYLFETVSFFYVNFQFLRSKKSLPFPNDYMHEFCHV